MVYMMSTTRAGRPNKEKTKSHSQNSKSDGPPSNSKYQPTSEQIRMANMTKGSNKTTDDPELEEKIQQVKELTGRTEDEACFALHDCDYDLNRAVEKLLESEVQGEWQELKTKNLKKKKNQAGKETEQNTIIEEPVPEITDKINHTTERGDYSNERNSYDRSGSVPRGRRNDRAPPRFQKAGRGRNQNEDDRERGDGMRDRGRGRGRGGSRGRGRGRGGGRRENRDRVSNYDNGPGLPIDTWTNDVADAPKNDNTIGNWQDMTGGEDWNTDEWQGSLKETTVFTASSEAAAAPKVFSDNDAKMFSVTSIETQAFNNTLSNSMPSPPQLSDSYQHSAPSLPDPIQQLTAPKPIGQNSIGQSAIGQGSVIGQGPAMGLGSNSMGQNSLGQKLDLGMLLSGKPTEYKPPDSVEAVTQQTAELTKETANFMAQFQKRATETIKSVVGIGGSSSQNTTGISSSLSGPPNGQAAPPQQPQAAPPTALPPSTTATVPVQPPQQPKQQRPVRSATKLPPPSKIPASAVVMPGAGNTFGASVDVEFGCFPESPGGFSFGSIPGAASSTGGVGNTYNSSSTSSSLGNHLSQVNNKSEASSVITSTSAVTSQQSVAMSAMLETMTQQTSQSPRPTAVFQNNNPTTPPKDYSQSKISSPPDPIPFPTSQTDRKSPYQPSGSLSQSEPSGTGQLNNYSQSNYSSSAYASSSFKTAQPPAISSVATGSTYSSGHGSSGLSGASGSSSLSSSNPLSQSGLQNYQSSSFQSQQPPSVASGGYSSGTNSGTSSLYQSNSSSGNPPSSFQSQNTSYNNQSSGGSGSSSVGGYQTHQTSYHTRDSQSAPAFQSSVTQSSGSAYQNSSNQSSSSGSSYQRDSSQSGSGSQSGYSSQQAYGSVVSASQQQQSSSAGLSSNKSLSESLSKLTVKDSSSLEQSLSQSATQYDTASASSGSSSVGVGGVTSLNSSTNTTASSVATGSVTVSSSLGISSNTGSASSSVSAASSANISVSKSALPVTTTKAPVNLPPGMPPLIGHGQTNYMIGQHGFPIAFGLQQPMYSYEDLLHQRLPMHTASTLTGLDQNKLAAAAAAATVSYTAADASKLNRVEAQSPVNAQASQQTPQQTPQQAPQQQQQTPQTQSAAHGQAAFPMPPNPAAGLPGYYNYYMGGLPQTGYSYPTHVIPLNNLMPQVTNAGVTSANTQFQKAAYGSYGTAGYDSISATHDFSKAYSGGASQTQNKVSAASLSVTSNSDLTGGAATGGYPKAHQGTAFDKSGFTGGTPPPFNTLPPGLPTGTQAGQGQLGGGAPYMQAQYVPTAMAAAAHPSQVLHQLHQAQDTSGGSSRTGQQSSSGQKSLMATKPTSYTTSHQYHWGAN